MTTRAKTAALTVLLTAMAVTAGCSKEVTSTIINHTDNSLPVRLTLPQGTQSIGTVGADSSLKHKFKISGDDLPARCSYSAGAGLSTPFTVTEDSPDKVWFHISKTGQFVGPMTKDDTYVHDEQTGEIRIKSSGGTVIE